MSSPVKIPAKISLSNAQEWIRACARQWKESGVPDTEHDDFIDNISRLYTKPAKSSSRTSVPVSERADKDFDPTKCRARVWLNGGFSGQCNCKKPESGGLCKRHQSEADKHDGSIKNGFYDSERPDYHYNDSENGEFIPWADSTVSPPAAKTKKTRKSSGPRKCSLCGLSGHNKRKCPSLTTCQPCSPSPVSTSVPAPEPATQPEPEPEPEHEPEQQVQEQVTEPGTEPQQETEQVTEQVTEQETVVDDTVLDTDDGSGVGLSQTNENTSFTYEGVEYVRDSNNDIFDPNDDDDDSLGKWISEDTVEFNRLGKKAHQFNKAMLS